MTNATLEQKLKYDEALARHHSNEISRTSKYVLGGATLLASIIGSLTLVWIKHKENDVLMDIHEILKRIEKKRIGLSEARKAHLYAESACVKMMEYSRDDWAEKELRKTILQNTAK